MDDTVASVGGAKVIFRRLTKCGIALRYNDILRSDGSTEMHVNLAGTALSQCHAVLLETGRTKTTRNITVIGMFGDEGERCEWGTHAGQAYGYAHTYTEPLPREARKK